MNLVNLNDSKIISTLILRDMINTARFDADEPEIRNNDFIARVKDELDFEATKVSYLVKMPSGQSAEAFDLTVKQATLVGMRESKAVRRAVLELLEKMAGPKLPQTMAQALRLAADQAELIEQQSQQLALAAPSVQFVERYVEAKSSKSLSDVAKVLGWKPQAFIKQLADDKIIFKRSGAWLPYQEQIDRGRFTVKTSESNGHTFSQSRIEPKGVAWLAKKFATGGDE